MDDLKNLEKELTETIGDGDKEMMKDILKNLKQSTNLSDYEKELLKDSTNVKYLLLEVIKQVRSKKVELPEFYKVLVDNKVKIGNRVEIKNLEKALEDSIKKIKIPEPKDEVKVTEIPDVKEPKWYGAYFKTIYEGLSAIFKQLAEKVLKVKVVDTSSPSKPVSVRLSDGKKFYTAMMQAYASGGGGGGLPFITTSGTRREALVGDDGTLLAESHLVTGQYDYIGLSYTGSDLTGVVYKNGGASGTVVSTLTLGYTGSDLTSVTKT